MAFETNTLIRRLLQWVPGLLAALVLAGCRTVGQEAADFTYAGTMTYDTTEGSITTQPVQDLATLDQAVVEGTIALFVEPHAWNSHVSFYLDDADPRRAPIRTDGSVPYDVLFDTTQLADGEHTLTAVSRMKRGETRTLETATFVTSNGVIAANGGDVVR